MRLLVALDPATATEATALARAMEGMGVGFSVGPRLLVRSGASVITGLRPFGPVQADARLGGGPATAASAARSLAAAGATTVVVGPGNGADAVVRALDAVRPHGAGIAVVVVHPDATDADLDLVTGGVGRGRVVSRMAAALSGTGASLLGLVADVGVVAQVAPDVEVVVWGIRTVADLVDARGRGAAGAVIASEVVDAADPVTSIRSFVEAAGAA